MTHLRDVIDANRVLCVEANNFLEVMSIATNKTAFLMDEVDHFIENNFISLKQDGTLDGFVLLRHHKVFMFSATLN